MSCTRRSPEGRLRMRRSRASRRHLPCRTPAPAARPSKSPSLTAPVYRQPGDELKQISTLPGADLAGKGVDEPCVGEQSVEALLASSV